MAIRFTCPHCGKVTDVADQYAGRTGPCAGCGKPVTIPGTPAADAFYMPPPRRSGMPVWAILLIVACCSIPVLGICAGILLPAIGNARAAARGAACINNLHQISIALLNYETQYGCFPSAYVADKDGHRMHSWRVLILPYLDRKDLYDRYRFDEPWNGPHNCTLAAQMPSIFCCPSERIPGSSQTSYLMVVGPGMISDGANSSSASQPRDLSETITVIDVGQSGVNWMEPKDCTLPLGDLRSNHPGGFTVAFADGHVLCLRPEELKARLSSGPAVP